MSIWFDCPVCSSIILYKAKSMDIQSEKFEKITADFEKWSRHNEHIKIPKGDGASSPEV